MGKKKATILYCDAPDCNTAVEFDADELPEGIYINKLEYLTDKESQQKLSASNIYVCKEEHLLRAISWIVD